MSPGLRWEAAIADREVYMKSRTPAWRLHRGNQQSYTLPAVTHAQAARYDTPQVNSANDCCASAEACRTRVAHCLQTSSKRALYRLPSA